MPRETRMNIITSPELIERVNSKNKRLCEDFASYMKSIKRSDNTIRAYMHDLNVFFVWNLQNNENKFFVDLSKRDVISFQNWMIYQNGNSPARVRRVKATLSSLSNFIENILDDEYPEYRPIIRKIESPPNQPVREKTILTDDQVDLLLNTLVERKEYQRACAVALAVCSGAWKSELPRFKVAYFQDENLIFGALYKTPDKIRTKGHGDGKYLHKYVLASKFKPYFDLWMQERKRKGVHSHYLLVSRDKIAENEKVKYKPILTSTLDSWKAEFDQILGVPFYWHAARHYTATLLLRAGIPESIVVNFFGWESSSMVEVYDDRDKEDEFEKYFDEGGFKVAEKKTFGDL